MKKTRNSGIKWKFSRGLNCTKTEVLGQLGVQLNTIDKWRSKLNFDQNP